MLADGSIAYIKGSWGMYVVRSHALYGIHDNIKIS